VTSKLTYANAMATIALFLALAGTGYAVAKLGKNSVRARQIAPKAVGKSEVDKSAVAGSEVKDGSIKPADLSAAAASGTAAWTTTLSDPPANPDYTILDVGFQFETEQAGHLLVRMDAVPDPARGIPGGATAKCQTGNPILGLYLDDEKPVPNSAIELQNDTWQSFVVTGVTAKQIPAGTHELMVGITCAGDDDVDFDTSETSTATAILLDG
jgi:hypothetical protein